MNQLLVGPSIGLEMIADNAVEKIKYCKGQTKESMADDMPSALRNLFEREDMRNGIYCAESDEDVERVKTPSVYPSPYPQLILLFFNLGYRFLLRECSTS